MTRPLIIAHRGASGYRPEHTLAAYKLAMDLGADYVEPDLVLTKDGVLVARHENELSDTTDVADHQAFTARRTTKSVDGHLVSGWFTEDFTLAELKALRATERLTSTRTANTRYDGQLEIATFDEVLDLVRRESRARGVVIGVNPELKHTTYFSSIGLSIMEPLLGALKRHHLDRPNARVIVQSFETDVLRELRGRTKVRLAQLLDDYAGPFDLEAAGRPRPYYDLANPMGLAEIATYADGIGANRRLVIPRDAGGYLLRPSSLVDDAHALGLFVHAFTLRDENKFLAADFRIGTDPNAKGDAAAEGKRLFDVGVDGLITDFPETGVFARADWLSRTEVSVS